MRSKAGFTLLEVTVASTIFAVVVASAYVTFDSGRRMVESGEFRATLFQTGRSVLREIERDIRAAYSSGSSYDTGLVGKDGGTEELPLDEIEVLALNRHTRDQEEETRAIDLSRVSYFIEEDGGLSRRRVTALGQETVFVNEEEDVESVSENVIGLDLKYFDGDWQEVWDSTRSESLPLAVEVTIWVRGDFRREEVIEAFATRFSLPLWQGPPQEGEEETQ